MLPILDLKRQYQALEQEMDAAIKNAVVSGSYILGPNVKKLEKDFAEYCGTEAAIGVANGTDALHIALRALNIGDGDEVITVAFTFVATTEAIGIVGATPVFADIDPNTYNIDVSKIEEKITSKTKAILPVHLYGQPCDMDPIMELAKKYNLYVVEDCAQAVGAEYKGKKVGSFGDYGCFSFFPSKNLGCYGDGGMVTARNEELATRVRTLRAHGGRIKYYHDELGLNSRLDEIQAAILNVKFPHIDTWNDARRAVAHRYNELFADVDDVVTPVELEATKCVYHQYTVKVPNRTKLQDDLKEAGIQSMIYYPVPLHQQKVHAHLPACSLPETEQCTEVVLSLPIFPELTQEEQNMVADAIKKLLCKVGV
ncbi:MAG: DegT/DnrJ/EryC1/StrS family aminotransferase [bacterium]